MIHMPSCCFDMLSLAGRIPRSQDPNEQLLEQTHPAAATAGIDCMRDSRSMPVGAERLSSQTLFRPARSMRTSYSRCAGAYVPSSFLSALQGGTGALNKPSWALSAI